MLIVSNRDSLRAMPNSVGWKKNKKVSSNILSAEIAQRLVNARGTSKLLLHWTIFYDTFKFLLNKTQKNLTVCLEYIIKTKATVDQPDCTKI